MPLAADQIRDANVNPEDVVKLIDVGSGVPGMPPVDGSRLKLVPPHVRKVVPMDKVIETGSVLVGHNHTIADGVSVLVEDDGEWLIL